MRQCVHGVLLGEPCPLCGPGPRQDGSFKGLMPDDGRVSGGAVFLGGEDKAETAETIVVVKSRRHRPLLLSESGWE
ncbi:hypothetical protein [Methylovulum psychrotolerans]|uniref:Uncharacterized protein n=1 Tax=Methylovulum psychrotolerans TaxID=1704499 RepID=A0A2S5CGF2_9GAMM|nr:hypothetical protein [Methylovulum psychrotolerans]POZ49879.1 hypothetical protein AADEFJLK_04325 [Methylovulum psychrotolerans]